MKYLIYAIIFLNFFVIVFFLQLATYAILSHVCYWRRKKKNVLSLQTLEETARACKRNPPKITLIIAAKNEANIISSTINAMVDFEYPKEYLKILFALDGKEPEGTPYDETTHCAVEERKVFYNQLFNTELIDYTSVPRDFDGRYPGSLLGREVPSTKPRALNWAMRIIDADTDIVGFYDADSHPEKGTLLYVAQKYLNEPGKKILLQGSVIQVRNYFHISLLSKIYSLFQGITHEWFLPILLKHLPFIGGTNFFVDKNLLYTLGGFDVSSLTEDLEFGVRAYLQEKKWPEFLPYVATEQTPPDYKAYFFQRARWSTGFLQITEKLLKENVSKAALYIFSGLLFYGVIPLILFQMVSLVSIGVLVLMLAGIINPAHYFPLSLRIIVLSINILYIGFIVYYFERSKYKEYIQPIPAHEKHAFVRGYLPFATLLVAPFFGCLPYSYGILSGIFKRSAHQWVKTPRTNEIENMP